MCQVEIIDPDFSAGCADQPDSAYYMYSLQGYAPCFFYDFTTTIDITVNINCQMINSTNVTIPTGPYSPTNLTTDFGLVF